MKWNADDADDADLRGFFHCEGEVDYKLSLLLL